MWPESLMSEIIDSNFKFGRHYTGQEQSRMRIKDSKPMHFITIGQTTHGQRKMGGEVEERKEGMGQQRRASAGSEAGRGKGKRDQPQLMCLWICGVSF